MSLKKTDRQRLKAATLNDRLPFTVKLDGDRVKKVHARAQEKQA